MNVYSSFPRLFPMDHPNGPEKQLAIATDLNGRARADTASTVDEQSNGSRSSSQCLDEDIRWNIDGQASLTSIWKELKRPRGGMYKNARRVQCSLRTHPGVQLSKMEHLQDVFAKLGGLTRLEEVVFTSCSLYMPALTKFLKRNAQTSLSLRCLKFHRCKFVVSGHHHGKTAQEKLWKHIGQQSKLTLLEIVDCYSAKEGKDLSTSKLAFSLPSCLQDPERLPALRRLVLDECILDNGSFSQLLSGCQELEELELRPQFAVSSTGRTYGAKKAAVHTFMTETVPQSLATNPRLSKLLVALDDYLLATVYEDAMPKWIQLLSQHNVTLDELQLSQQLTADKTQGDSCTGAQWETVGILEDVFGRGLEVFSHFDTQDVYVMGFRIQRRPFAKQRPTSEVTPTVSEKASATTDKFVDC